MCGISGILKYGSTESSPLSEYLGKMNQALKHRGPDDEGVWIDERNRVGLAQTRLSILDLTEAGHQPMFEDISGNVMTYNGEVFNFKDINKEYFQAEHFFSETDTETLLKLYRRFKADMFNKMNGMFAFAVWDQERQELLLARDPSGKKPLYYTEQNGRFVFASELKAILCLPWVTRQLDEEALYDFITYSCMITPATMFKEIYKFKPGHFMRVSLNGIKEYEPYFELRKIVNVGILEENELSELLYQTLQKSVEYRMISDVPVGAFLSGGVDSSAIVALMRENSDKGIDTFSVGFADQPDYTELQHAEKVSKLFDTNHHNKIVQPQDLLDCIDRIVEIYDEPQADTTAIPIYFISQLARDNGIKVVLNGDGPDELFAGYRKSLKYINYDPYFQAAKALPDIMKKGIRKLAGAINDATPFYEMACRLERDQDFYWPGAGGIKAGVKNQLLTRNFQSRLLKKDSYQYVEQLKNEYFAFAGGRREIDDFTSWLCFAGYRHADIERYLFRSDRLGMANSIETRSPFLNHEMVELALSVGSKYKVQKNIPKYILKKSLERILPQDVLYRQKMGFCVPVREWAGDTIHDYVARKAPSFCSNTDYFNLDVIQDRLRLLKLGKQENTNIIWALYFFMNWHENWF